MQVLLHVSVLLLLRSGLTQHVLHMAMTDVLGSKPHRPGSLHAFGRIVCQYSTGQGKSQRLHKVGQGTVGVSLKDAPTLHGLPPCLGLLAGAAALKPTRTSFTLWIIPRALLWPPYPQRP